MVTEKMIEAAARVLNRRLADGSGLHGVSRAMLEAALSTDAEPVKTAPSVAVKALEWKDDPCPAAESILGHYVINERYAHVELLIGYGRSSMTGLGRIELERGSSMAQLKEAAQADYEARIRAALSAQVQDARSDDDEETYQIGIRDGYSQAVQEIDRLTGGDGEYRYCTDHDPERHTPEPAEMIQRIVDRFETLNLIGEAEKRGDFWDVPGPAQVQDVAARYAKVKEHLNNIEVTADAVSSPYRNSIIRKNALAALSALGQEVINKEGRDDEV